MAGLPDLITRFVDFLYGRSDIKRPDGANDGRWRRKLWDHWLSRGERECGSLERNRSHGWRVFFVVTGNIKSAGDEIGKRVKEWNVTR